MTFIFRGYNFRLNKENEKMQFIIMFIITALIYAVAYIKSESNIFQYKYEREMRNADYWRNEAIALSEALRLQRTPLQSLQRRENEQN